MSLLPSRNLLDQLGRFSLVGALNTFVGYAVIFLVQYFTGRPLLANALGYGTGLLISFALSQKFVFGSKAGEKSRFPRFIAGFAIAYCLNLLTVLAVLAAEPGWPYIAQIAGSILYLVAMFTLSKLWVFRSTAGAEQNVT